jgi:large conductance mechanosensitive channel
MAGLARPSTSLPHQGNKTWMPAISAGMTTASLASLTQERHMLEEFKKFALRGNAVDLAIGVIIGAAFGAIVNSVVGDILSPIIGAATGGFDFSNYFIALSSKVTADSLVEAKKQGAVLAWGNFVTIVINFIIIAWILFLVVKLMNRMLQSEPANTPALTKQEMLLTEIRDLLKREQNDRGISS